MKTYAFATNRITNDTNFMCAFDAIRLKEKDYKGYKLLDFYYKINGEEYPVYPRFSLSTQRAYFVFYNRPDGINTDGGGETLTHYVAKNALLNLSKLHLVNDKKEIDLCIRVNKEKSCNEKRFDFEDTFYADVYYELDKHQEYYYKWYGVLVLEVEITHKDDKNKCSLFEKNNVPIFEVKISKKMIDDFGLETSGAKISEDRIEKAIINMTKIFEKNIYGDFISNPSSEEYELMNKYKNEIKQFKDRRDREEKDYLVARSKRIEEERLLNEYQLHNNYYESIIQENEDVKNINENLSQKNEKLSQELDIAKEKNVKLSIENERFNELNYAFKHFLVLLWNKIIMKMKK